MSNEAPRSKLRGIKKQPHRAFLAASCGELTPKEIRHTMVMSMNEILTFSTHRQHELVDITTQVKEVVSRSGLKNGLVSVYAQGATAAIMIQENWDESVQNDVINLLKKIVPHGVWQHDAQDDNGDAHLKAGLIGPSETIPLINGQMGLSTWQNIFFCEFDGPRHDRRIVVTVLGN